MLQGAQKTRMDRLAFRRALRSGSCLLFAGSPYMPRRLKVFRTTIGFHDAYVAAPSRKAALSAWGTTKDLFASEAAEEVTEPALIAEVLARPGEVIRKRRAGVSTTTMADDAPRHAQIRLTGIARTSTSSCSKRSARRRL